MRILDKMIQVSFIAACFFGGLWLTMNLITTIW